MEHIPVLLKEAIEGLDIHEGDIFVDGTLGGGGHAELAFKKGAKEVIGIDLDSDAIARVEKRLSGKNLKTACTNFRNVAEVLDSFKITKMNRFLLDLGLSSFQLDEGSRGFTFRREEPLTMTLVKDPEVDAVTAYSVVNTWSEESLADIIYGFGEERYSRRIAAAIKARREEKPIETTTELADIIFHAVPAPYRRKKIHPATKTFQAIRIAVNDELGSISQGLTDGFERLEKGGRIAVISFHSLEDRIVKNFIKQKVSEGAGIAVTKKPIIPTDEEIRTNTRSRSSKLRIIEKII